MFVVLKFMPDAPVSIASEGPEIARRTIVAAGRRHLPPAPASAATAHTPASDSRQLGRRGIVLTLRLARDEMDQALDILEACLTEVESAG